MSPRGRPHRLSDEHAALLSWLPRPLFGQGDAFDFCDAVGLPRWRGVSLWNALIKFKLIERSSVQIGKAVHKKRFYWQRAAGGKGTPLAENLP